VFIVDSEDNKILCKDGEDYVIEIRGAQLAIRRLPGGKIKEENSVYISYDHKSMEFDPRVDPRRQNLKKDVCREIDILREWKKKKGIK
jgi:hypothetical protein